jgi:20S proteasome subunit beta 3
MSDPSTYYGGSVLAMRGKDAIAIASDLRLGHGAMTVGKNFSKLYTLTPKIVLGLAEFVPDCQAVFKELRKHVNMFRLNQGRDIEPEEVCSLLSTILYSKRFSPYFIDPIIIGFDRNNQPHMYSMDCIGCVDTPSSYTAAGTADVNLTGIAEVLYEENMEVEDLFVTTMQAFLNSVNRDALSGWGAEVIILTPTERVVRKVHGRQD